jgi:tetratricopeptide (TPR) repeat protein
MTKKSKTKARVKDAARVLGAKDLPQFSESWVVVRRQARIWITEPGKKASRPYLYAIVDRDKEFILGTEIATLPLKSEKVRDMLLKAMKRPPKELSQKSHRPSQVYFEEPEMVEALRNSMQALGIQVDQTAPLEFIDPIVAQLNEDIRQGNEDNIPSLLANPDVTPDLVRQVYQAAEIFFAARPWDEMPDDQPVAVKFLPDESEHYVQLMGQGGMEFGLLLYSNWDDLVRSYDDRLSPTERIPADGWNSFTFTDSNQTPWTDLDNIEQYDWPVFNPFGYPVALIYHQEQLTRPGREDLLKFEALLRALPIFANELQSYIEDNQDDMEQPLSLASKLEVETYHGKQTVFLHYPAGDLPEWDDEGDNYFDEDFDSEADRFVTLAEEEAESPEQAYEFYKQGVEAGRQALGDEFFEEHAGQFWRKVETRGYMRARLGLAQTLEDLDRTEEAIPHYQDLLGLNPDDHQGVRYELLRLYLQMNRSNEASDLLATYQEDKSAMWVYSRALLAYLQLGSSEKANNALQKAFRQNPHVPPYLSGNKSMPEELPLYIEDGGDSEAAEYAFTNFRNWWQTPGAVDWLKEHWLRAAHSR